MGRSSGLRPEFAKRQKKAVVAPKILKAKRRSDLAIQDSGARADETEEERTVREKRRAEISALEDALFGGQGSRVRSKKRKVKQTALTSRNPSTQEKRGEKGLTSEGVEGQEFAGKSSAGGSTAPRKSVWIDPDDENVVINIAADPKLRKLRKSEKEREISGVEYQQRLRDLHEKIIGRKAGLDWIKRARRRKGQVEEYANDAGGRLVTIFPLQRGMVAYVSIIVTFNATQIWGTMIL